MFENFLTWATVVVCGVAMAPLAGFAADKPTTLRVYIGTYSGGDSRGIYVCELDRVHGTLSEPRLAAEARNPSFLELHPSGKFLYAVGEYDDGGKKGGGVSAFAIEADGSLTLLNSQSSEGSGPCHVTVDRTGKYVLVANYGSGSVACLPIREDGGLESASSVIQHEGKSVNPRRQEGPHAHSINLDAANRFAIAADLGLDKLLVYRFDAKQGTLTPNDPPSVSVAPGGGPRHFAFHPNLKCAYANNELTSTVTALSWDAEQGTFEEITTVSTLPAGYDGSNNSTAETRVHPNGKFVYVSNRGHDSIAIFRVTGGADAPSIEPIGHESTRGKTPRNFNIDPSGKYLLAANQDSGNVVVFRVDERTGKLTATGSEQMAGKPVCIRFLALE